jgi:hypothetical protein
MLAKSLIAAAFSAATSSASADCVSRRKMTRVAVVLASLLTAACATAYPHPRTSELWGYFGTPPNPPNLELLGYGPDRPSCENSRAAAQERTGPGVSSKRLTNCQPVVVLPYRAGVDSVYWVFSAESGQEYFALGANDHNFCANLRNEMLKTFGAETSIGYCEPLIVKRAR